MTPERWQEVKHLYRAVLEAEPSDRGALLESADLEVRREVESLLSSEDSGASPLDRNLWPEAAEAPADAAETQSAVLGQYQIHTLLGRGGMGEVYRAHDQKLGRNVAVKTLPREFSDDPDRLSRFRREARVLASLNHPNIAAIYGLDEAAGVNFLILELVDGETLAERLKRTGPMPVDEALAVMSQVADALEAAHRKGITHRDIKPANVMVTADGHVKVLDFGLAKLAEPVTGDTDASTQSAVSLTREDTVVGTVAYMSPEQARGEPVDVRTDVFSFGVVLYEVLSGHRPFQGDSQRSTLAAILSDLPAPRLKELRPDVPSDVDKLVARALEKDRERRYHSAAELKQDLAAFQRRLASPGLRSLARKPKFAVPALALLVTVLVATAWFVIQNRRQNWARTVALPEIARLLDKDDFDGAFRLGRQAEQYIPQDPALLELKRRYAKVASIQSAPHGAAVYVKGYLNANASWLHIGKTPLVGVAVPGGYLRWRAIKDGFTPADAASYGIRPVEFALHPPGRFPAGMVPVPGGVFHFSGFPAVRLEDYWLDKYEVTNKQFKEFVEAGAYQKPDYWKHPFVKDGKTLSWQEAMAEFRDTTGRPGPSTWLLGANPPGHEDFPVGGVSWYEAAAYAEFAGKSLPTVHHWLKAHATPQASEILRLSNFSGRGPAAAGSHLGLSPFGNYDMAGNVREWCWNRWENVAGGRRYFLGASWSEAPYRFPGPHAAHPWDRSAINGFRCARYESPLAEALTASVESVTRDYSKEKPVSDDIFQVYRSFYSYPRTDLKATVESVDETAPHWRREEISFNAAYGAERVIAYLFLPRNVEPPYQTVIYFPSGIARQSRSNHELELPFVDFLPRIGRAVLYLVYKGTHGRHIGRPATFPWDKDLVICWSRDFSRAIDYLETRADIDHQNLGYYSFSNPVVPVLSAISGRIKAGVHIGAGFPRISTPPEYDSLSFAPRASEPTLLIGGRYDFMDPLETSQKPLLRQMGAPDKDKRLAVFDTGHVVYPGPEMIKEVLDWLDRYLGPVKPK